MHCPRVPQVLACLIAVVNAVQAAPGAEPTTSQLSRADRAAGWKLLFDGKSSEAWRGYRQAAFPGKGWVVEDECLKSVAGQKGGDIVTIDQFGDFELQLEWKAAPAANSGIMYRVAETQDATWQTGPEFQILDDGGAKVASQDVHSAGALYDLHPPATGKVLRPAGEFNLARIRLKAGRLEHWLNDVKIVDCDLAGEEWKSRIALSKFKGYAGFGLQPRGHIALQEHGDTVWFRNIRIRDLEARMPGEVALFDGSSLKGWTCHLSDAGKMADVWRVEQGIIVCKGQPSGYLRTERDFTNFVLKLEWRFNPVTKQAGNSGVLFRMVGPDRVWPKSVEAQLHSGNAGDFWNIDDFQMQTDPARTSGRNTKKLRAAEHEVGEWNEYEIIVDGGDVTLKINGDTVNRAWNVAEVPGKICFQSEGAEIHFRNIRLAPIQ